MEPVTVFDTVVAFGQCDPNGHLNTAEYTALFDRASWLFLQHLRVWEVPGPQQRTGWADARVVTEYKHEVRMGEQVRVISSLTKVGRTSIGIRHEMRSMDGETLFATFDSVTVRYDSVARAAVPVPEQLRDLTLRA
ncbi:MAG: acyl-CoA thioesterase [Pseudomonadota bacterium]|nr:acyl-CoA thioesterase [Pseudomonadota bacterium]